MIGTVEEQRAGAQVGQLAEAKAMGKFVQQRSYEIRLVAVVVVEAEIEVERAAEVGGDVVLRGDEVGVGEFVCQCNVIRSEEHTSELQSRLHLVCRLLL